MCVEVSLDTGLESSNYQERLKLVDGQVRIYEVEYIIWEMYDHGACRLNYGGGWSRFSSDPVTEIIYMQVEV